MNKQRIKWLREQFYRNHGRFPNKTVIKGGDLIPSEWRQVKKHWVATGDVL